MIPGDNTTALERLAPHQPAPVRFWPGLAALLLYLCWDTITGLGYQLELLLYRWGF